MYFCTLIIDLHSFFGSGLVNIYVSGQRHEYDGVVVLRVNKDDYMSQFTICLWVYPFENTTAATVINYGGEENLKIYFNNSNFIIDMQEWSKYVGILIS